jgi:hypothetical protein
VEPQPIFVAGPQCLNSGATAPLTYTVNSPGPGPFTFTWTLPPGWQIDIGNGTNSITVTPSGTTVGNVSVNVCTGGNCCKSISRTVIFDDLVITPSCYNVGLPGTMTFSVAASPIPGTTYTWAISPNLGAPTPSTTNTISVQTNFLVDPVYGEINNVSVTRTSPACGSQTANLNFVATPNGVFSIFNGGASTYMEVSGATGSPTYQWLKTCSTTPVPCTSCGTSFNQTLTNAGLAGSYGVNVIAAGCITRFCANTSFGGTRMSQLSIDENGNMSSNEITLSPNPNGGDFELAVQKVKQGGDMVMFDAYGKQVFKAPLQQGVNRFDQKKLANGTYFLRITVDGAVTMKKMEIIH